MNKGKLIIAAIALLGIALHLFILIGLSFPLSPEIPLIIVLIFGGIPLVLELSSKLLKRQFGSDLLAGISIVTAVLLGEYLAGAFVVLMLSGGEALEEYALQRAASALSALADRIPLIGHRRVGERVEDIPIEDIEPDDLIEIYPHEIVPVDGIVQIGRTTMDESFLTGEPYKIEKVRGSHVISGAINGESAVTIKATSRSRDSRYSKIVQVMSESSQSRPRIRRIGDQIGAWYTPIACLIAVTAWALSGDASRFLAVLVVATPCPVLIAIPTALIGSISLAAKRGIIIRDPVVLERAPSCRTIIFDKTGTLTYGEPELVEIVDLIPNPKVSALLVAASLERYSKHPLAKAVLKASEKAGHILLEARELREPPGHGLIGQIDSYEVEITGRKHLTEEQRAALPSLGDRMECIVIVDRTPIAIFRFRDTLRTDSQEFIAHLSDRHNIDRSMIVSGDRISEVSYLANLVGIKEIFASQSPEEKVEIVRKESLRAPTIFLGDGINDAPALLQATVGLAMGQRNEVTSEAAGAVILDGSLSKVDEFLHISKHLRTVIFQSAGGGMAVSIVGMFAASFGFLTPVGGAIAQEVIDLFAVLNALRASFAPSKIRDYNLKAID